MICPCWSSGQCRVSEPFFVKFTMVFKTFEFSRGEGQVNPQYPLYLIIHYICQFKVPVFCIIYNYWWKKILLWFLYFCIISLFSEVVTKNIWDWNHKWDRYVGGCVREPMLPCIIYMYPNHLIHCDRASTKLCSDDNRYFNSM